MTITAHKGTYPHIEWIDLKNNGVLVECAVMKRDTFGNIYYIEVPSLDVVDRKRMARIMTHRNAPITELWDLMSQITLNNGVNALDYFHQLVKVITPQGVIMNPRAGVIGTGVVNTNNPEQVLSAQLNVPVESAGNAPRKTKQ